MKSEVYLPSRCIVLRAAKLYYLDRRSQKEIAAILGLSVSTVSRLLRQAEEEQVIQFAMPKPFSHCLELEQALKTRWHLEDVLVTPADPRASDERTLKKAVALEGARYLQRTVTAKDVLGIAWGGTMYELIQYLNPCLKTGATFVTLHGSIPNAGSRFDVKTLVNRMAMAFGGRYRALAHAGLLPSSAELQELRSQSEVAQVFSLFDRVTISVTGIGAYYPEVTSPLDQTAYLTKQEQAELLEFCPYCDFLLRFLDAWGRECRSGLAERTLAIELARYRKIPRKLLVASGTGKVYCIRAALRGGLADVLILDQAAAEQLLELSGGDEATATSEDKIRR